MPSRADSGTPNIIVERTAAETENGENLSLLADIGNVTYGTSTVTHWWDLT